jgi:hypothetical protein
MYFLRKNDPLPPGVENQKQPSFLTEKSDPLPFLFLFFFCFVFWWGGVFYFIFIFFLGGGTPGVVLWGLRYHNKMCVGYFDIFFGVWYYVFIVCWGGFYVL